MAKRGHDLVARDEALEALGGLILAKRSASQRAAAVVRVSILSDASTRASHSKRSDA